MLRAKIAANEILMEDVLGEMPEEMQEFFAEGGILGMERIAAQRAVRRERGYWLERLQECKVNSSHRISPFLEREIRHVKLRLKVPLKTKEELREATKRRVREHRERKRKRGPSN